MKLSGVFACLIVVLLGGCGSDSDNDQSPLVGKWVTESCEEFSDIDSNALFPIWAKGSYEFTRNGNVIFGVATYSDATCITVLDIPFAGELPSTPYNDLGPVLLEEGIEGGGISIDISDESQSLMSNGFYFINDSLCFSERFTFGVFYFGASEPGDNAIDFDNCLVRR